MEENLQQNVENILGEEKAGQRSDSIKPNTYKSPLKPLRTYQGDVNDAVTQTKASVVSIALAEQTKKYDRGFGPEERTEVPERKNKFFVAAGAGLLILGVAAVGTAFFYFNSQNVVQKSPQKSAILSYTNEFSADIASSTREGLIKTILTKKNDFNSGVNSILYIETTEKSADAPAADLFSLLTPKIPPALLRNLNDKYMIGVYSFDTNEPFIILTTDDYGQGYAGMLKWEGGMISDLGELFNISPKVATDTPYVFSDESIRNKDLRIVKGDNGQTVLFYSFLNQNTVLISSNEKIFNAILSKYLTAQMIR